MTKSVDPLVVLAKVRQEGCLETVIDTIEVARIYHLVSGAWGLARVRAPKMSRSELLGFAEDLTCDRPHDRLWSAAEVAVAHQVELQEVPMGPWTYCEPLRLALWQRDPVGAPLARWCAVAVACLCDTYVMDDEFTDGDVELLALELVAPTAWAYMGTDALVRLQPDAPRWLHGLRCRMARRVSGMSARLG